MKKEPVRHHYIPQFILRNFCIDEDGNTFFVDAKSKQQSKRQVSELFTGINIYVDMGSDEISEEVKENFARFENEVAPLIKEKLLEKDEFVLTDAEDEKLILFFTLMMFRFKYVQELFREELSTEWQELYSNLRRGKKFDDFWKRNLAKLAQCRSLGEAMEDEEIDESIKTFLIGTLDILEKYICVVEPREGAEFVLGDSYPIVNKGVSQPPFGGSYELGIFDVYVLSPNRAVLFANFGCQDTPRNILKVRPAVLSEPILKEEDEIYFRVRKLYPEEVKKINDIIILCAREGYISRSEKA